MKPLEPPDTHCLAAADGWLELGVPAEAEAELGRISAAQQVHPDVLEMRWLILAHTQRWGAALEIARALVKRAPDRSSGWLHQAYALRRVPTAGLREARDSLLAAYDKFPGEPTISYNLSCYACQLRQLDEARTWLRRALDSGSKQKILQMALDDPDLEPLWDEIRKF